MSEKVRKIRKTEKVMTVSKKVKNKERERERFWDVLSLGEAKQTINESGRLKNVLGEWKQTQP